MESFNKVLIVDDDATARFLITKIIQRVDLSKEIITANNGQEALELLKQVGFTGFCPELILLDINMPLMDGFEFLDAMLSSALLPAATKIVLLSSSNHPQDVERAKKYPGTAYVVKPLTEDKLKMILV